MKKQKQDGKGQDVPANHAKIKLLKSEVLLDKLIHMTFIKAFQTVKQQADK